MRLTSRSTVLRTLAVGLAALSLGLVPSCASPSAPEGFTLAVQLVGVNLGAVESLRITFAPVMEGSMTGHFLQPTRGTSFEDGGIQVGVDSVTGLLTMSITGAYFAAHATTGAGGSDPRLEIELWTDDRQTHMGPQVRATVTRGGVQIATGVAYLPSWPPALGDSSQVNVPCMTGLETMCAGN